MWGARKFGRYAILGAVAIGSGIALHNNQVDINSIGIVRLTRAATTVFKVSYSYQMELYSSGLVPNTPEFNQRKSEVHKKGAEALLKLCCLNRGVFIKVGQHIGALEYLIPSEYVETMKILHSQAPASTLQEIYQVVKEDFHCSPDELFVDFCPNPIGAASLAQVHRATLKNGEEVAVKVQHPTVKKNAAIDLKTMEVLVKLVEWAFPDFKFQWLVDEMKRNVPFELNFENEGLNSEKAAAIFQHFSWLKVPNIYWKYSSPRVLTMEFVTGGQVNDLKYIRDNKINPYQVSHLLGHLYSQMIFVKGFIHSDPHPGNILVRQKDNKLEIILLDHGLYNNLSDRFRCEYSKLWLSIMNRDQNGMKIHSENLGVGEMWPLFACMVSGRTWESITTGIEKKTFDDSEKEEFQKEIPNLLSHITNVLGDVDRQMLLVFRTNDLIRGIEYTLKTHARMSSFLIMTKCCIRSVYAEQMKNCSSMVCKAQNIVAENVALLRISLYYIFLSIKSFSFTLLWQILVA